MTKSKVSRVVFIGDQFPFVFIGPQGLVNEGNFPPDFEYQFDDSRGIPVDNNEFAVVYRPFIRRMVLGFPGLDKADVEDNVQEIIKQFIAGDYLNVYSASKQSAYAEKRYLRELAKYKSGQLSYAPVKNEGKFTSFLFEFVKKRLLGIRDKTNRRKATMDSLDTFYSDDAQDTDDLGNRSLLHYVGISDNEFANIEIREMMLRVYWYLVGISSPTATKNLPELFVAMQHDAFHRVEGFDRQAYAQGKGITISAVSMQVSELRMYLEQYGFYNDLKKPRKC